MKFPNAAKGVSKIFTAEILQLIAVLFTGVTTILGVYVADSINHNTPNEGLAGAFLIFAGIAAVLAVVAFIVKLVGCVQASRDESFFKVIIWLTLISIIVSIVAGFFSNNWFWNSLANAVRDVTSFFTLILVILGVSRLAIALNDPEVIRTSGRLLRVIILIGIISLIARFFSIFMPSMAARFIVVTLACIYLVFEIFQYVLYISLLAKAKRMLKRSLVLAQ